MSDFHDFASAIVRRLAAAAGMRPDAGEFAPQELELIPGMPAAPEPVALFNHWDAAQHPHLAVAQVKVNGIRTLYVKRRLVSRQALPMNCALHCLPALVRLEERYGEEMVIDGEYAEEGGLGATLAAHKRGRGEGIFHVFDAVPYREWAKNRFTEQLQHRLLKLGNHFDAGEAFLSFLAPFDVHEPREARAIAASIWQRGGEGIVVKDPVSTYWRGRGPHWQKLKQQIRVSGVIADHVVKDGRATAVLVKINSVEHGSQPLKVGTMPNGLRAILRNVSADLAGTEVEVGATDTNDNGRLMGAHIIRYRNRKGDWSNV